jgi:hypothetical protein
MIFANTTLIKKVSSSAVNNASPLTEEVAQEIHCGFSL